jgi:hypothetical protein
LELRKSRVKTLTAFIDLASIRKNIEYEFKGKSNSITNDISSENAETNVSTDDSNDSENESVRIMQRGINFHVFQIQ